MLNSFVNKLSPFLRRVRLSESGATAIEYGLIASLLALAVLAALNVGTTISGTFDKVDSVVQDAGTT